MKELFEEYGIGIVFFIVGFAMTQGVLWMALTL